jgi:hypothetical protein
VALIFLPVYLTLKTYDIEHSGQNLFLKEVWHFHFGCISVLPWRKVYYFLILTNSYSLQCFSSLLNLFFVFLLYEEFTGLCHWFYKFFLFSIFVPGDWDIGRSLIIYLFLLYLQQKEVVWNVVLKLDLTVWSLPRYFYRFWSLKKFFCLCSLFIFGFRYCF